MQVPDENFLGVGIEDSFEQLVSQYEDWLNDSQFNYTTDTMVLGPKDPLLEYILEEYPETLIVRTVKSRSYVR